MIKKIEVLILLISVFVLGTCYGLALQNEIEDFVMIGSRFAENHDYINNTYKCNNFTNDLYDVYLELGFEPEKIVGCDKNLTQCHSWLRFLGRDFSPIRGRFTNFSEKYPKEYK